MAGRQLAEAMLPQWYAVYMCYILYFANHDFVYPKYILSYLILPPVFNRNHCTMGPLQWEDGIRNFSLSRPFEANMSLLVSNSWSSA